MIDVQESVVAFILILLAYKIGYLRGWDSSNCDWIKRKQIKSKLSRDSKGRFKKQ